MIRTVLVAVTLLSIAFPRAFSQSIVADGFEGNELSDIWDQIAGTADNYSVDSGNLIIENTEGGVVEGVWRTVRFRTEFLAYDSFLFHALFDFNRDNYKLFDISLHGQNMATDTAVVFRVWDSPSDVILAAGECPDVYDYGPDPVAVEITRLQGILNVSWGGGIKYSCHTTMVIAYICLTFQQYVGDDEWAPIYVDSVFATNFAALSVQSFSVVNCESSTNVVSHSPIFGWDCTDGSCLTQDSAEIEIGIDSDWNIAELWQSGATLLTDTLMEYAGSELLDGQTYYARIRLHNFAGWSAWHEMSFCMNSLPSAPVALYPLSDEITDTSPTLWVLSSTDAEGDTLWYEFGGFHDTDCVHGAPLEPVMVVGGQDSTGLQVGVPDPLGENCTYWWTARAFDGFEYSDPMPLQQFYVDGIPESPTVPELNAPDVGSCALTDMTPSYVWSTCFEPDPFDTVRYELHLSLDRNFDFAWVSDPLLDTTAARPDSLEFNEQYWWKVTAEDRTGLTAESAVDSFWTWTLGDVDNSHAVNVSDLTFLVAYLFQGQDPPCDLLLSDIDGSCAANVSDLTYLVAFLFGGGVSPMPCQ